MTNFLLRIFIRGDNDPKAPAVRARMGILSGAVGIFCNLLLFAGKIVIGTLAGSVSIVADAWNNLSDAASSIVTLVGFKLSGKPADAHHPYGHARMEYLSGLAVAALMLIIGFELGRSSVQKIFAPENVAFSAWTAVVLIAAIAVKLWMYLFNRKLGRTIDSSALLATAADSRNDVLTTAGVLVAGVTEAVTGWHVDGFVGLAVAAFILWSGWQTAKQTISPLLGEAASPELRGLIVDYISRQPGVLGYHDLMVHDYGPGQRFASIHVEMDMRRDPLACHELIDDMERECLRSHNIHLVIHHDPVVLGDPEQERLKARVSTRLKAMDPRLRIHDFRVSPRNGEICLIFDVSLPAALRGREDAIRRDLEEQLSGEEDAVYRTMITFDPEDFGGE